MVSAGRQHSLKTSEGLDSLSKEKPLLGKQSTQ